MPRSIKTPDEIAQNVLNQLTCACGDIAACTVDYDGNILRQLPGLGDSRWTRRARQAKADGVIDLHGWLADEIYNDSDTIRDYLGDWIHDNCNNDVELYNKVCIELIQIGHSAVKSAAQTLIRD